MKWPSTDLRAWARHVLCAPRCLVRRVLNVGRRWRGKGDGKVAAPRRRAAPEKAALLDRPSIAFDRINFGCHNRASLRHRLKVLGRAPRPFFRLRAVEAQHLRELALMRWKLWAAMLTPDCKLSRAVSAPRRAI